MRITLALLCFLGVSFASYAQDKNFDLSKYKFPDYKRHELKFNLNSSGNSSKWSAINSSNPDGLLKNIDYNEVYSSSDISLDYTFIKSTRKRQENIYSTFSSSYYFHKSSNEFGSTTQSMPNANFSINAYEKYYLTEDKWYLEVDPGFQSHALTTRRKYPDIDDFKEKSFGFSTQIGLGGGIGRMENVTEFWQAYYILEGLKEQGLLIREPSEKDIYELATLASQLKSKRFFDSRLKKIDDMKSIDSMMHRTNLIDKTDISYFNTLNDYWNFANISYRSSGRILKLLITPGISHWYNKELGQLKQISNETNLKSEVDFRCSKQLNLFWERNLILIFSNMTSIDRQGVSIYDNYPKNFQDIFSDIGWNFYPNFRTQLNASLSYQASQFVEELNQTGNEYEKVWSNTVGLNSSIYYYLSPQLRIEAYVNANYKDKFAFNTQKDKLDINYSLGFHYAIF